METISYATETKSIKEHSCDFCGFKINTGEIYMKSTHKHEGEIYDWKTHKYCSDLAERLKMYDNADEGVTQDIFQETINCEHDDLLINLFPQDEIQKYSDVIQQLMRVNWKDKLGYVVRYYNKKDKIESITKP